MHLRRRGIQSLIDGGLSLVKYTIDVPDTTRKILTNDTDDRVSLSTPLTSRICRLTLLLFNKQQSSLIDESLREE